MSSKLVLEKSEAIFERLCLLPQYKSAKIIMAYMSFRNEVSTMSFVEKAIENGKRIVLPRVEEIEDSKERPSQTVGTKSKLVMSVYEIHNIKKDTMPGFKGILEPCADIARRISPEQIDVAVIPGVAFDMERNRIGYGGGFYDRFIPSLRQDCYKAGVAFQMQIVNRIPEESFDIPVDIVITENMCI